MLVLNRQRALSRALKRESRAADAVVHWQQEVARVRATRARDASALDFVYRQGELRCLEALDDARQRLDRARWTLLAMQLEGDRPADP